MAAAAQRYPDPGADWIACALGNQAARDGFSVQYKRLPRLLDELAMARVDGKYTRLLARIAKIRLLILDDWGTVKLTVEQRRDLMEVIEDRYQRASTSSRPRCRSTAGTT